MAWRTSVGRGVWIWFVASTACFTDASGNEASTAGASSGGMDCVEGDRGCPCYPNGTCNADFVCLDGVACFPADCVAGTEACPCLSAGGCDVGLECNGTSCVPAGTSTSGTTATTTMASAGSDSTGGVTTVGSTGGPACTAPDIADAECSSCFGMHCCEPLVACAEAGDPCHGYVECIRPGMPHGECEAEGGASAESEDMTACMENELAQLPMSDGCRDCAAPVSACLGSAAPPAQTYWSCTECAALACCAALEECIDDDFCDCMQTCLADPFDVAARATCNPQCDPDGDADRAIFGALADCTDPKGANCTTADNTPCYPSLVAGDPG